MTVVDTPILTAPAPAEPAPAPTHSGPRTIWGLDPVQLHSRYWASHGVQVVRQGEPSEIVKHAELFLLTENDALTLFKLGPLMEALNWIKPQVLFVRLHDARERGYRENVVTGADGKFVRFQRLYDTSRRLTRVVLTPDRDIAQLWQSAPDAQAGWRRLRRVARRTESATQSIGGNLYDRHDEREVSHFVHDLVQLWKRPDFTAPRAKPAAAAAWKDPTARVEPGAKFIGPVWVGA